MRIDYQVYMKFAMLKSFVCLFINRGFLFWKFVFVRNCRFLLLVYKKNAA